MAKKNKTKIIGGLMLVGAGVAGYFLYRQSKKSEHLWGIGPGIANVDLRRNLKTHADRYALKADVFRVLMGKNVTATSHDGFVPFELRGGHGSNTMIPQRVIQVRR